MKRPPLVSVIIPAYNAQPFIRQTVLSVLNQTYDNLELFLVDDGSSDKTPEFLEHLSHHDSRITVLHQPNKGVASVRKLGN